MKKGFTLVELLAAIALISILSLVAIPTTNSIVNSAHKRSFEQNANSLMRVIQLDREDSGLIGIDETMVYTISSNDNSISYNGSSIETRFTGKINGNGTIYVSGDGDIAMKYSNDKWCTFKNFMDTYVTTKNGNCDNLEYFDVTPPTLSVNSIAKTTKSITITFTANDPESAYSTKCEYGTSTSYGSNGEVSGNLCILNNLNTDQTYYYRIISTNSQKQYTIVAGDTSPSEFSTITITPSDADEYTVKKTITLTGSTQGATLQYQIGSTTGAWVDYTTPFEIQKNTTIYARYYDGLNASQPTSLTITKIVNEAGQIYYSNSKYFDGSITVQEALEYLYQKFDY